MAFVHGKDSHFELDGEDLTPFLTDVSLNKSAETAETSVMGIENKTYIEGLKDGTISMSGRYDSTASTGPDAVLSGASGEVAFEYGPEGTANGKVKYTGNCIVTSYQISSPVGDVVGFTADAQITGAVTKGTYSA